VAGYHEHGELPRLGLVADLLEGFDAAHLRKTNVQDDEVDLVVLQRLEALLGRRRLECVEPGTLQHHPQGAPDVLFVVDDEDGGSHATQLISRWIMADPKSDTVTRS
jgi:hypothetical protein